MTTQGKCIPCKKRFIWNGKPLLRNALCPICGTELDRTSHLLQYKISKRKPKEMKSK